MSKYTTELRFICENLSGSNESHGYDDIEHIISNSRLKIFDFSYPIFDENYRSVLETKILKHFYTREIGSETYGLWKLRLNTRLNEIMPYYNRMYESELLEFNPLYTHNVTRNTSNSGVSDTTNTGTNSTTVNNSSLRLFSDTPQGAITGIENETYLTDATKISDTGVSNGNNSSTGKVTTTENYLQTISGYEGVIPSELIKKYRETFLNIDMLIIKELEVLFFQLW